MRPTSHLLWCFRKYRRSSRLKLIAKSPVYKEGGSRRKPSTDTAGAVHEANSTLQSYRDHVYNQSVSAACSKMFPEYSHVPICVCVETLPPGVNVLKYYLTAVSQGQSASGWSDILKCPAPGVHSHQLRDDLNTKQMENRPTCAAAVWSRHADDLFCPPGSSTCHMTKNDEYPMQVW